MNNTNDANDLQNRTLSWTIQKKKPRNVRNEFLYNIFNWDPEWLRDKKYDEVPPPVIDDIKFLRAVLHYENIEEYQNVMLPMLIHEYWYKLKQDFEELMNSKRITKVDANKLSEVSAETVLIDEHRKIYSFSLEEKVTSYDYPRNGELVQLFGLKSKGQPVVFAYIDNLLEKVHRRKDNTIEHIELKYDLLTNISVKASPNSVFCLAQIAFLLPYLSLLDALNHLQKFPVCKIVLSPNSESYTMPIYEKLDSSQIATEDPLNSMQLKVMSGVLKSIEQKTPKICFIQGPPGTGKSKVIVNLVASILKKNGKTKVLVCAPSNKAIDSVVLRLLALEPMFKKQEIPFSIIRVGDEEKMNPLVKEISLTQVALKRLGAWSADKSKKNKRNKEPKHGLLKIMQQILQESNIITSTLTSCYTSHAMRSLFSRGPFSSNLPVCIVDEAAQTTELQTLVPLLLGTDTLVLVGDPQQLPPIVLSEKAKNYGYDTSLFARAQKIFNDEEINPIVMLNVQYRMADAISKWPNSYFYNGAIEDSAVVNPLGICNYKLFNHTFSQDKEGHANEKEAELIVKFVMSLRQKMNLKKSNDKINIGIITPYHKQRILISKMFNDEKNKKIKVLQKPNRNTGKGSQKYTSKNHSAYDNIESKEISATLANETLQISVIQNIGDKEGSQKSADNEQVLKEKLITTSELKLMNNLEQKDSKDNKDTENNELINNDTHADEKCTIGINEVSNIMPIENLNIDEQSEEREIKFEKVEEVDKNSVAEKFNELLNNNESVDGTNKPAKKFLNTVESYEQLEEKTELNTIEESQKTLNNKPKINSKKGSKKKYQNKSKDGNIEKEKSEANNMQDKDDKTDYFIEVNTVDSFQGSERDIIILSCVRSCGLGFTKDPNRLCVSLTRAKHSLFLFGNFKAFSDNDMWNSLITDAAERNDFVNIENANVESILRDHVILNTI